MYRLCTFLDNGDSVARKYKYKDAAYSDFNLCVKVGKEVELFHNDICIESTNQNRSNNYEH